MRRCVNTQSNVAQAGGTNELRCKPGQDQRTLSEISTMSTEEFIAANKLEGNIAMALFTKHSLLKESKGKHTSHNIYYYLNSEN